jgi:uncharacterized protein (TIGR02444 family)
METLALLAPDNPFWQFSLRVYAVPEAAAECLDLQRVCGINVNVLLFCSWIALSRHIALDAADIGLIESEIQNWHALAVLPLREIRDRLKSSTEMRHQDVQAFRRQIFASELRAEQIEQALIFQRAELLPMRQVTGSIRDIMTGNISLLCSLAPVPQSLETPISVSALIAASLAFGED